MINTDFPDTLYVLTANGLYRTGQALSDSISSIEWEKIRIGLAYDLEFKPNNLSTMYLTIYDTLDKCWKVEQSINSGTTWTDISTDSIHLENNDIQYQSFTVEVTKQDPDYLYLVSCNYSTNELLEIDLSTTSTWTRVGSHKDGFGNGHNFGVSQVGNDRTVLLSRSIRLVRYDRDTDTLKELNTVVHVDVEDVVFHPYFPNVVWICTHGGVEISYNNGDYFHPRWEGLGIAMVDDLETSYSNPRNILCGLYHDGTQMTNDNFDYNWTPTWKKVGWGDGQRPIIDHKDERYMWASSQCGAWRLSENSFDTSFYIKYSKCYFETQGTLNKENTEVLFRNRMPKDTINEYVIRSSDRGVSAGIHDSISAFSSIYTGFEEVLIRGLYSPYDDGDVLIANVLFRKHTDTINPEPEQWHLFRTNNANSPAGLVQWNELILPRNNNGIADVEFDPEDNKVLYICYAKSSYYYSWPNADSLFYKIDYNNASSPLITDMTGNLPYTSVGENSVEVVTSINKGFFVATEFGVFYTDSTLCNNQQYEWQLVGKGLPHLTCGGLEYNWPASVLRIGTWGRGVWELPMPCDLDTLDIEVRDSTVWNTSRFINKNIVIKNGGVMTINGPASIHMVSEAKIVVEPGGKLVVDGATITNACGEKWQGIEVWGNSSQPQVDTCQGKVELYNANISHAHEAVELWKEDDFTKTGGMIYAENSTFLNNRRTITALSYQSIHPVTGKEIDYNATFKWCTFKNDKNYIDDNPFYAFATLWDVKGVKFLACEFYAGGMKKPAIYTIDAGYNVGSICNGGVYGPDGECVPKYLDKSEFHGFDKAISSQNTLAADLYPINIQHTLFSNNNYGCWMSGLENVLNIKTSDFSIGNTFGNKESQQCAMFSGRGIHIQSSTGFFIENNSFYPFPKEGGNYDVIGIAALSNPSNHDIIYNNSFNLLKIGNTAVGNNRERHQNAVGIEYQCNENYSNNYADFEVENKSPGDGQINQNLGYLNLSAHNKFSDSVQWHWRNMGEMYEYYYRDTSEVGSVYDPDSMKIEAYLPGRFVKLISTEVNGCEEDSGIHTESLTLSPEEKTELELKYAVAGNEYDAVKVIYDDLKDGGDTPGTSIDIETAQPEDTWDLRDNLLGKSPYLSREILEQAANKTEVLPNSVLMDILSANPDELKDPNFIHFLETKNEPLPGYMIDILMDVAAGTTYKTALLNQMAVQKRIQTLSAKEILNSLINETEQDNASIRNWLGALKSLTADMQIAALLIREGSYTDADTLLEMIPELYNLEGEALNSYLDNKFMLNFKRNLQQSNRNYMQLDSTELAQLEIISENHDGLARASARAILELFYGHDKYCDCLEEASNKSTRYLAPSFAGSEDSPLHIVVSPNPANHYVEFSYELSEIDNEGIIIISDMNGKPVTQFKVNSSKGVIAWDTRRIPAGTYIFTLRTKYFEESGKLIIQ